MLRLGAERDAVDVVDDQVGCPTWTGHLAPALVRIAERRLTGVMHVAGGGACSWFELARETFDRAGVECEVRPQSTSALGRPAPRPAFSVLRSTRTEVPVLPSWSAGLDGYLNEIRMEAVR
jgi:dTDP-4-dehydrorhamnose reductase